MLPSPSFVLAPLVVLGVFFILLFMLMLLYSIKIIYTLVGIVAVATPVLLYSRDDGCVVLCCRIRYGDAINLNILI